ncbi:anhydro-N-acetylmuramic acid kinase [Sphingomonas melonis TY]|jgi:anhydro-N-acetylmuramic acid kinase|uniref:Anhydro-N-acetylmuramic acid kinase n=1 Tax=Sphingomonas melonis TY TaxID=621456 RepID=A0A154NAI0_9SPHN|nr:MULTISPECIES: anhydro-N-acetylmuramic acid kinase [Sphingomonas]AOW23863.1 anhydro-N-acetylmuramic acid kinase [Sphingomonas melonis TY]ATI54881.1 anhydro-N-acetylmuramic acid kinase [Sphingomonas melonis]KZB96738.1 anhydro-N-acetylmuramic acid kinase [Sphingomonas melonis TY]MBI0532593.1 anhydro-N-acetylmuramic acid kinase [Sphingomonas sp. TX0522]MBX8843342.1 anhydro-N-acetylmuramic acid kinase [Sphingomonas melonis]
MLAIGLMSGTSLDGIDAALIDTDGEGEVRPLAFRGEPYSDAAREQLAAATALALTFDRPRASPDIVAAGELIDRTHAFAVHKLLRDAGVAAADVAVIGYHGQTVAHRPDRGWTWQIGDGAVLARATGIAVVSDMRSADVAAGGQGAPLLPIYHAALTAGLERPVAVLNLGGVGNVTFVGEDGALVAFDTGPANGLIDSWVEAETGARYDADGALAASGHVDEAVLTAMLDHPYFAAPSPKSLDRNDFTIQPARGLSAADGAATLTAFTAATVAEALDQLPARPKRLIVAGGGRHNPTLLRMIGERTGIAPEASDTLGWDGDAMEAEGFAYMAVRTLKGLPISFPGTTGVPHPLPGGRVDRP